MSSISIESIEWNEDAILIPTYFHSILEQTCDSSSEKFHRPFCCDDVRVKVINQLLTHHYQLKIGKFLDDRESILKDVSIYIWYNKFITDSIDWLLVEELGKSFHSCAEKAERWEPTRKRL